MSWKDSLRKMAKKSAVAAAKGAGQATRTGYEAAKEIDYKKHAKQITAAGKATYLTVQKAVDSPAGKAATSKIKHASQHAATKVLDVSKKAATAAAESLEAPNASNFYARAAAALEGTADAILRENSGTSARISRIAAMKVGGAGTAAGLFGLASLIGTASTGTAISTLSGAAFTNSALAWLGGSVATGSVMISAAGLAGGAVAVVGAGWLGRKYVFGEKRSRSELVAREEAALDACLAMSAAFRSHEGRELNATEARALSRHALNPLVDELAWIESRTSEWPSGAKLRFAKARRRLDRLCTYAQNFGSLDKAVGIGVVSAVFLKLSSYPLPDFSGDELIALQAIRRSNTSLRGASEEELSDYVQTLSPEQLQGFQSNVKGIYHELRYVESENTDEDAYTADIFEATNHPGADVRLVNIETGEVTQIQLKATQYERYVREHNQRYQDTDVFVTEEVARKMGAHSSGFSNADLEADIESVTQSLRDTDSDNVVDSMVTAGMVNLALNVRLLLNGKHLSDVDRRELLRGAAASTATAGFLTFLIGQ